MSSQTQTLMQRPAAPQLNAASNNVNRALTTGVNSIVSGAHKVVCAGGDLENYRAVALHRVQVGIQKVLVGTDKMAGKRAEQLLKKEAAKAAALAAAAATEAL